MKKNVVLAQIIRLGRRGQKLHEKIKARKHFFIWSLAGRENKLNEKKSLVAVQQRNSGFGAVSGSP